VILHDAAAGPRPRTAGGVFKSGPKVIINTGVRGGRGVSFPKIILDIVRRKYYNIYYLFFNGKIGGFFFAGRRRHHA
jgi:hypothetical protein